MTDVAADPRSDRALGALIGLALGDAMGMPSQTLNTTEIRRYYGRIENFTAPFDHHPVSHGLGAAMVTDDTEQAILLAARLIASEGCFDTRAWVQDLLNWESDIISRGLRDLLGPSSKRALQAIAAGAPVGEAGRAGTTNGAAMRIAPMGIAVDTANLTRFVDHVEVSCRATHNTGEAIASAAAVAAVISAGVDGATFDEGISVALAAAAEGQRRGYVAGETNMAGRIRLALETAAKSQDVNAFADAIGTSVASRESVAAAFGVVRLARGETWSAAVIAANIGDDTDTIGAIACAMAGATTGAAALPATRVEELRGANELPFEDLVPALLRLRGME